MVLQEPANILSSTPPEPTDQSGDFSLTDKKSAARRVLVVDDEPLVRWSLAETLADEGFEVVEAADRQSVTLSFLAGKRSADVVLLDLRLPDCNDLQLLSEMCRLAPSTPVILMTAFGTPDIVAEALEIGAFSVIAKPFDMADVGPLVRRALTFGRS